MNNIVFHRSLPLSEHFSCGDFLVSRDWPDEVAEVILTEEEICKLQYLALFGLEHVWKRFGPTFIDSGYRTPKLNSLVHGQDNSQHLLAEAVDFIVPNADIVSVYQLLEIEMEWPGELICYQTRNFIHMALPRVGVKSDRFIKT